eukprot:7390127-Prymnesium_polylepis.2
MKPDALRAEWTNHVSKAPPRLLSSLRSSYDALAAVQVQGERARAVRVVPGSVGRVSPTADCTSLHRPALTTCRCLAARRAAPTLGVSKVALQTRAGAAGRWGVSFGIIGFFLLYEDLPQLILQTQYGVFPGWSGVFEYATGTAPLPKSDAEFEGTRYGGAFEAKSGESGGRHPPRTGTAKAKLQRLPMIIGAAARSSPDSVRSALARCPALLAVAAWRADGVRQWRAAVVASGSGGLTPEEERTPLTGAGYVSSNHLCRKCRVLVVGGGISYGNTLGVKP